MFLFLFFNVAYSINTASEGYKIPANSNINITARQYYCSTSSVSDCFAPTKTDLEWNSFLSSKPSYITCIPYCADNTIDYTAWANTTCASTGVWNQTRSRTTTSCYDVQIKTRQSGSCSYCTSGRTDTQSCLITNGIGTQSKTVPCVNNNYDTSGNWSACAVSSCNSGYIQVSNTCTCYDGCTSLPDGYSWLAHTNSGSSSCYYAKNNDLYSTLDWAINGDYVFIKGIYNITTINVLGDNIYMNLCSDATINP